MLDSLPGSYAIHPVRFREDDGVQLRRRRPHRPPAGDHGPG
ncbi:hypothetical protein [Streptomyces sp. PvR034]